MDYTKEENLVFARQSLKEGDLENALGHYALLNEKDPDNEEAKFFIGYFLYDMAIQEHKGFVYTEDSILRMANSAAAAVKSIKESDGLLEDKIFVLKEMAKLYFKVAEVWMKGTSFGKIICQGTRGLYAFGDAVEAEYGSNPECMKLAVEIWKQGVKFHMANWDHLFNDKEDGYVEKIKKADPSYAAPSVPLDKRISGGIGKLFSKLGLIGSQNK